jgi:hypothetical protein
MIYTFTAHIAHGSIYVELFDAVSTPQVVAKESRPDTLAKADTMLTYHGFRRVRGWDLDARDGVCARVKMVKNVFGGTRAARLWEAVGTTHKDFEMIAASQVEVGDLISDRETSEPYVVADCRSHDPDGYRRILLVSEGEVWEEGFTSDFPLGQMVRVAKRRR